MFIKVVLILITTIFVTNPSKTQAVPIQRFILGASFGDTDFRDIAAENALILWQESYLSQLRHPFISSNGDEYIIEVKVMHHQNNLSLALANYNLLVQDPNVIAVILPFPSAFSIPVHSQVVVPSGKVSFTVPIPLALMGQPNTFFFSPTAQQLISTALYQLRFVGVHKVLILHTTDPDAVILCGESMESSLKDLGVILTNRVVVVAQSFNQSEVATQNLTDTIALLEAMHDEPDDFDGVMMCAFTPSNQIIIDSFKKWIPEIVVALPQIQPVSSLLNIYSAAFVSGPIVWSPVLPYPGDDVFGTPEEFETVYTWRFNTAPIEAAAGVAGIAVVFEQAVSDSYRILRSGRPNTADLAFTLYRIDKETVFGRVRFNTYGENLSDPPILQYFPDYSSNFDNQTNLTYSNPRLHFVPDQQPRDRLWNFNRLVQRVVYPPRLQTNDFFFPIPGIDERDQTSDWFDYSSEIAVTILDGIGIFISFCWMVFVFVMRTHDAVRYASPAFLLTMIFGTIILYLSVFTWMLYVNDDTCMALPWLVISGFCFYFGSLLIKLYRIWKITDAAASFKHYKMSMKQLGFLWAAILGPPAILLIIWTAVAPLTSEINIPDPLRPSTFYYSCHASGDAQVFIGLLGGYCLIMFVAAFFLIKMTWKIDRIVLNESIWLAFAIWTLLLCAVIEIVIIASGAIERETEFVVRSVTLIMGVGFSLCIFFIPKIFYIREGKSISDRSTTPDHSNRSTVEKSSGDRSTNLHPKSVEP